MFKVFRPKFFNRNNSAGLFPSSAPMVGTQFANLTIEFDVNSRFLEKTDKKLIGSAIQNIRPSPTAISEYPEKSK